MKSRRETIKSAAAAGVVAVTRAGQASATSDEKLFVELDILHKDVPEFPPSYTDNVPPYGINPVDGKVYESQVADSDERELLTGSRDLVGINELELAATPETVVDPNPDSRAPIRRGFRRQVAEKYVGPKPRVRFNGTDAIVAIANQRMTLTPGEMDTLELEPRGVRGHTPEHKEDPVERQLIPVLEAHHLGSPKIVLQEEDK